MVVERGEVKSGGAPGTKVKQCPASMPAPLWGRASLAAMTPSLWHVSKQKHGDQTWL